MQHETRHEYGDYPVAYTLERGPVKVTVYHDEMPWNPRKEDYYGFGELILHMDRYTLGDEGPGYNRWRGVVNTYAAYWRSDSLAASLTDRKANLPDSNWLQWPESVAEVDWNESVDVRVAIPLRIRSGGGADPIHVTGDKPVIGRNAYRKLIASMLEGDDRMDGIFIATADDIREEYGSLHVANLRRAARRMEGELEEYAAYVAGENYYMVTEDHNGKDESLGLPIGSDYAEDAAREELDSLYDAYVAEVEATGDWAARMGVALPDTWITTGVAV